VFPWDSLFSLRSSHSGRLPRVFPDAQIHVAGSTTVVWGAPCCSESDVGFSRRVMLKAAPDPTEKFPNTVEKDRKEDQSY
jgi:hypothetical protein